MGQKPPDNVALSYADNWRPLSRLVYGYLEMSRRTDPSSTSIGQDESPWRGTERPWGGYCTKISRGSVALESGTELKG